MSGLSSLYSRAVKTLVPALVGLGVVWFVTHVRINRVNHSCSGARQWHVSLRSEDDTSILATHGVFTITTYALANGFGLGQPDRRVVLVSSGVVR